MVWHTTTCRSSDLQGRIHNVQTSFPTGKESSGDRCDMGVNGGARRQNRAGS